MNAFIPSKRPDTGGESVSGFAGIPRTVGLALGLVLSVGGCAGSYGPGYSVVPAAGPRIQVVPAQAMPVAPIASEAPVSPLSSSPEPLFIPVPVAPPPTPASPPVPIPGPGPTPAPTSLLPSPKAPVSSPMAITAPTRPAAPAPAPSPPSLVPRAYAPPSAPLPPGSAPIQLYRPPPASP